MAQSRLEKVGTIYSRIRGLLSTGALKQDQVWESDSPDLSLFLFFFICKPLCASRR